MAHFIDKYNTVLKQCFDTAVITDNRSNVKGKIVVRYTDSSIGYNSETGIFLYTGLSDSPELNYTETRKKGSYHHALAPYELFKSAGFVVLDHHKTAYDDMSIQTISTVKEMRYIKKNRKIFNILWV